MPAPPIKPPEYGDVAKLGSLRMTDNPAQNVQSMKRSRAGRPVEGDLSRPGSLKAERIAADAARAVAAQQQAAATEEYTVPPEHAKLFDDVNDRYQYALDWVRIASHPNAGELTRRTAAEAIANFRDAYLGGRESTPWFDEYLTED